MNKYEVLGVVGEGETQFCAYYLYTGRPNMRCYNRSSWSLSIWGRMRNLNNENENQSREDFMAQCLLCLADCEGS